MAYIKEVTADLYKYMPSLTKRADFDEFWQKTLDIAKSVPLNPAMALYDYPSPLVRVYSISYNGFDETRINGWYIIPEFLKKAKYPCLINYHGANGNRGKPADFIQWILMGAAVLSVDCRSQNGETGNCAKYSQGSTQSFACRGILNKDEYYYRAVYMDCLKAIDFACLQAEVDTGRIIIHGGSQGGALGMAVCSLDDRPYLAMVDVPSNSNLSERVIGAHGVYSNITEYLKTYPDRVDQALETLSYFDTMNMADRIKCKLLASVALKDDVCPAKFYFASYNRIQSEKQIEIYPFNGHEGGGKVHNEKKLRFLQNNI